jgi:hypothetical protein
MTEEHFLTASSVEISMRSASSIVQNFSLEDASVLCSTIEKWQSEHRDASGDNSIDWSDISRRLKARGTELSGQSFTPEECKECWTFLAIGAGLPTLNQLREQGLKKLRKLQQGFEDVSLAFAV